MFIGTPKEIKADEFRVGLVPATVADLVAQGHAVAIETRAGEGAGISDDDYAAAGAKIVPTADEIFRRAELIVKVKEPLASERRKLRGGQMIFTYLHLAPDPEQTHDLMASGVTAIAYETVTDAQGKLPLLAPMSAVAGRMAPQVAAHFLERPHGGRGLLLGGIEGAPSAKTFILGGGVVARNAAMMALGMGAEVTIVARRPETMRDLAELFGARVRIVPASEEAIEALCLSADVVIGAALVVGAAAPKLISASRRGGGRDRRCFDRSGRLRRDLAANDALAADLSRWWRRALLRGQHAGGSAAHVYLCAQQRDASFRIGACRQRISTRTLRRRASAQWAERAPRQGHLPRCGRRASTALCAHYRCAQNMIGILHAGSVRASIQP